MDNLEIIWLLGLGAWALVSRLLRSRQRPAEVPEVEPQPRPQPVVPQETLPTEEVPPSPPQSLRELWQEIRRGIREASAPTEPVPEPVVRYRRDPVGTRVEPEVVPELPPLPVVSSVPGRRQRRRSVLAQGLIDDLSSGPSSLARAMLLREVLGPPVALRNHGSGSRRD